MINIIGDINSSEYRAAEKIKAAIHEYLRNDPTVSPEIKMVVGAKTFGERRQDIDILIIGRFLKPLALQKSAVITGSPSILSFCAVIEVKDHSPERLKFIGNKLFVKYKEGQEDATEQVEQQKYSLKSFLERKGLKSPFIVSALLLNNCPSSLLPETRSNILGGDFTPEQLFDLLYLGMASRLTPQKTMLQAFKQGAHEDYFSIASVFTRKLEATRLDRKKIELITSRRFDQKYANENLGKHLLIFSGPGGTGKTVNLMQLAHYAYRERNAKCLILTYNLALVSDITRLTTLIGISEDLATPKVQIRSVHSFMYDLLCKTDLFTRGASGFLDRYESLKDELRDHIAAVNNEEIEHWDYVFVDEAQDWPTNERDIIYALYGTSQVIIADGKSQLVRSSLHCDWTRDKTIKSQYIYLSKSLRLKAGICNFVNAVIDEFDLPEWKTDPNLEAYGGRVIVYIGDMSRDKDFIASVISEAIADENREVDLFFCLPPSMVAGTDANLQAQTQFSKTLEDWGYKSWNGLDADIRHTYPTSLSELRIVQYDSCRGLEGWSVFNFALDELYDYKFNDKTASNEMATTDYFIEPRDPRERFAKRWLAIPLTRAIDTLVLNVKDPNHWLAETLKKAGSNMESVTVIERY